MKKRRLTPDERAIWKRVTQDVRPLFDPPTEEEGDPTAPPETARGDTAIPSSSARPVPPVARKPQKRKPPAPSPFLAGDPALDRRARRGALRPERRLDLHGLTQAAARVRLEAFLQGAARDGLRCVLVITGKGAPDAEPAPFAEKSPRGVLRRRFHEWMEEPALRGFVSRVAGAAPGDGGSGAFYVFLKGRRKSR